MFKPCLTAVIGATLLFGAPAVKAESFTDAQKEELNALFEEYLMNNGEVLMKSVEKFQIEEQVRKAEEAKQNIKNNADFLYSSGSPSFGPDDADVTIVEFFDYNCGYCKKALTELQTVLDEDSNIKVIFKEMPILSPTSLEAAKWALAADKQGKYFEYHVALMDFKGAKNENTFRKVAEDVGLDVTKMEADKELPEIVQAIETNVTKAGEMGIRGTPAFIIDGEFSPGYVPADELKRMIADVRNSKDG